MDQSIEKQKFSEVETTEHLELVVHMKCRVCPMYVFLFVLIIRR